MGVSTAGRSRVDGKFHFVEEKLYLRGVTYGTFRPQGGSDYPPNEKVERDFRAMAAHGINALRTYTVPPPWLLDLASENGLRVLVGLAGSSTSLSSTIRQGATIEARVRDGARACAGHPAVLGYAIGNEIPASIVRWHGRRRIERFLERLCCCGRRRTRTRWSPTSTIRRPSTSTCPSSTLFASTSSSRPRRASRPTSRGCTTSPATGRCVLTELGLDSIRNGERRPGVALDWQIRTAFASRMRRRVRLLLDRRVAPRRLSRRGLGLRPHRPDRRPKPALGGRRATRSPTARSATTSPGRASRSSSAPTTVPRRSRVASRESRRSTIPTSR